MSVPAFQLDASIGRASHQPTENRQRLRILSYNIQTGISTGGYRHYLTKSWRQVLPHPERLDNLDRIATMLGDYDMVGLQEVDGGSLRSGFINQTEYLAHEAGFPLWFDQTNRDLGKFARYSMGLLTRYHPSAMAEWRLPGRIPGRGAMHARFGHGEHALHVVIMHLALGRRGRLDQLAYIAERIQDFRHVVLMGDFNCCSESEEVSLLMRRASLQEPVHGLHTFPSWRPARNIDHIFVSSGLNVCDTRVLMHPLSDHLPLAMEVELPESVILPRHGGH